MAVAKPRAIKKFKKMAPTTPEKLLKIVADVQKGSPVVIACTANLFDESHFYKIVKQGMFDIADGLDTLEARVAQSLRANEQKTIHKCIEKIEDAEKGHRGAEWILERRFWQHFSANTQVVELAEMMKKMQNQFGEMSKQKELKDES